jgi:hypothetical protein
MAGENFLPVQHYPDDFSVAEITLPAAIATTGFPLIYADRDLVIDSVTIGFLIPSSTASQTGTIQKTTGGSRNGITVTAASPAGTKTTVMGAGTFDISTAGTVVLTTETSTTYLGSTLNKLDAGNWLLFIPSGTTAAIVGTVQIRYRSRPK